VCGSLGLSLGIHAAALGALLLGLDWRAGEPQPEAGGGGVLRVVLVREPGVDAPAVPQLGAATTSQLDAPAVPRTTAHPEPAPVKIPSPPPALTVARVAAPLRAPQRAATPPPPAAAAPPAVSSAPPAAGPAAAGPPRGVAGSAPSGAPAGRGHLSRVARPAAEIRARYPEAARARGDEAEVIVEAWVAASGRVADAWVRSSAGPAFDSAALEAVRRARFHPAWRDGEPVDSQVAMRLHFELER
jgi:TonB family protein